MPSKSSTLLTSKSLLSEWLWAVGASLIVVALSSLPYWIGYQVQTEEIVFSGAAINLSDYSVHQGTMQLAQQGEWAYKFIFSNEEQNGAYVKLFYIFLGHLAGWLNLSGHAIYQLGRVIMGFWACLTMYWFISLLIPGIKYRRVTFILGTLGSGLGWFQWITGLVNYQTLAPIDFWTTDGYFFNGLTTFPHYPAAISLQLLMVGSYIQYTRQPKRGLTARIAAAGLLLQTIQSFAPLMPFIAIGTIMTMRGYRAKQIDKKEFWGLAAAGGVQLPYLLYNFYIFTTQSNFSTFAAQTTMFSPPFIHYLWGFGLFWPVVIYGLIRRKILADPNLAGIAVWMGCALVMAYVPWGIQRRFMFGFNILLAILFVITIRHHFSPWLNRQVEWLARRKTSLALLILPFFFLSSLMWVFGRMVYLSRLPDEAFYPAELVEATAWLGENSAQEDVVFSSERSGQLVGAQIGRFSYIGHLWETAHYEHKTEVVTAYYNNEAGLNTLGGRPIQWVIYGPYEKRINLDFEPGSDLVEVYSNNLVTIYRVHPRMNP